VLLPDVVVDVLLSPPLPDPGLSYHHNLRCRDLQQNCGREVSRHDAHNGAPDVCRHRSCRQRPNHHPSANCIKKVAEDVLSKSRAAWPQRTPRRRQRRPAAAEAAPTLRVHPACTTTTTTLRARSTTLRHCTPLEWRLTQRSQVVCLIMDQ